MSLLVLNSVLCTEKVILIVEEVSSFHKLNLHSCLQLPV